MDQQLACPHCQGLFMAPAVSAAERQASSDAATAADARPVRGSSPARTPAFSTQPHLKYLAAAAVMIAMTVVPVAGFVVVRWLSGPAAPRATARSQPMQTQTQTTQPRPPQTQPGPSGVLVSGNIVMHTPVAPSQSTAAQTSAPPPAAVVPDKSANAAETIVAPAAPPAAPVAARTAGSNSQLPARPASNPVAAASADVAQPAAGDTTALVQRIEPSVVVVQVTLEKTSGLGSGFPLDDKGTIVTNYHVIEGAKSARIKFGQRTAEIEGFLAFSPGKDIAILKAKLGPEKIAPLALAANTPAKGETVLTFGAPQGFDSTVSNGIVSSVRKGTDLQGIFKQMTGEDVYVKHQHYDLDATWVQTTAPISGGNSGGPLVNLRGEVVGLNTWALTRGQNMNFAISANHIKDIMRSANSGVHPLAELPAPREHQVAAGSGSRTLEYWEQVSKINRNLATRLKAIRQPSVPGKKVSRAQLAVLYPKLAGIYKKLADMLPEAAAKLKALKIDDVDGELVALVTVDAVVMEKIGQEARDLSADAKKFSLDKVILYDSERLGKKAYGEYEKVEIGVAYDVMRIKLTNRYGETFANIFDASARPKSGSKTTDEADTDTDDKTADAGDAKREKDAAGKLKFAKSLKDAGKREAAKERLQKIVEDYAGTKAAEEAQKLLDELAE